MVCFFVLFLTHIAPGGSPWHCVHEATSWDTFFCNNSQTGVWVFVCYCCIIYVAWSLDNTLGGVINHSMALSLLLYCPLHITELAYSLVSFGRTLSVPPHPLSLVSCFPSCWGFKKMSCWGVVYLAGLGLACPLVVCNPRVSVSPGRDEWI